MPISRAHQIQRFKQQQSEINYLEEEEKKRWIVKRDEIKKKKKKKFKYQKGA